MNFESTIEYIFEVKAAPPEPRREEKRRPVDLPPGFSPSGASAHGAAAVPVPRAQAILH